ncbi:MAG TPA: hypothetical protein VHT91_15415 [Kofleriaceae bacterium]|nr:hypothetical protein [Kofleriaceae bacterium]
MGGCRARALTQQIGRGRTPVDFAEFTQAARALGAFWLRYNEPAPVVRT